MKSKRKAKVKVKRLTLAEQAAALNNHSTIKQTPINTLCKLAPYIFIHSLPKTLEEVVVYVWTKGTVKQATSYCDNQYEGIKNMVESGGGSVTTTGDRSDDEYNYALTSAAHRIAVIWEARGSKPRPSTNKTELVLNPAHTDTDAGLVDRKQ